ncbi:MAG: hypothetical protein NUV34_10055, partial [Sulfuricaulis sp.]|nr:hypothetical protein [Sulfuricaulis sp.]
MASPHPMIPFAEREDGAALPEEMIVDMGGPQTMEAPGMLATVLPGGEIDVDFDPGKPDQPVTTEGGHYENLAEQLDETVLSNIAQDVEEMVRADSEARAPWFQRLAKGMELLGLVDEIGVDVPFEGASTVVHPLLNEAVIQFQAQAFAELFPPTGPAKGVVLGKSTRELEEQAKRVENYENYRLTVLDKIYYPESDKLLWLVGYAGSMFRKSYNDPLLKRNVARMIKPADFIVPYSATTLEDAPRYTHLIQYSQHEMKQLQDVGFYRKTELGIPSSSKEADNSQELRDAQDKAEGKVDTDIRDEDREHIVYEMTVDYLVPKVEGDEVLPYVISVERDSLKVLAIRRGWKEYDQDRRRRIQVVHYPFIRGDGFYGWGLLHLGAGLGKTGTGLLRVILDNAAWAALQGGFKTKDSKLPSNVKMAPGKWIDTEMTAEELAKCFYTPPFKDVPQALFLVLELITNMGQRLVNTTQAVVGDAKNTGPVGTTVALIEQASKVQSTVQKRLHFAVGEELQLQAELDGEHLPDEGYPYNVPGESREIMRSDFDERVDVLPVSDPNIFSQTQRIAIAQAQVQLADAHPELYDAREVHRRMNEALRVPDIDAILPDRKKIERCDPVTENALSMIGTPIKVFPDQDHDAHIAVHMGDLEMLAAQQSPSLQMAQQIRMPHIAEHEAQSMRIKMMQGMGMELPPLPDGEDDESQVMPLPPELENQIAVKAAEVMQSLTKQLREANQALAGEQVPPAEPDPAAVAAKDEQIKDMAFQKDEARKDAKLAADVERDDAKAGISPVAVKHAQQYLQQRGLDGAIPPRRLAVVARELGKSFD